MSKNPNHRKNGGKGTFFGNLLRGILKVGKTVSPKLAGLIESFEGGDASSIEMQLAKEGFDENELKFLLAELDKDKQEIIEITKRWESDNRDGSWLSRNVRPWTCAMYNIATLVLIFIDSFTEINFKVDPQWITLLLSNLGIVNTAYFGSRYLEKRDNKKYS